MSGKAFRSALERGEFACTAELVLGRDHGAADAEAFVRDAAAAAGPVKAISLTDLPGGNPALPPEAFASYVLERGLSPIAHLTGKDGNRSFLEGRLHALARLGVENVLALTGDAQKDGFAGRPKAVHDLDSPGILSLIEAMREGIRYQLGARAIQSAPFDFFAGAVVNPYKIREPDQMMQLYKLELKIRAGARFIITQIGFNLRKLYELRQYLVREGLSQIPVLASIYVPTAIIARMMQAGDLAGCVVSDALVQRLEKETKAQRLERAALLLAAVRNLGFAGAHIGGFGLAHKDFVAIIERSAAIGGEWRARMDELIFAQPGEFYLLPQGQDGLSDGEGSYRTATVKPGRSAIQVVSGVVHKALVAAESPGARFFASRLRPSVSPAATDGWRRGFWYSLLGASTLYRKAALGCLSCGDCIQDHLNYAGCPMRRCYKELRNGPCGGSRPDGACEARSGQPCLWNMVYLATLASGGDPREFGRALLPPRDWSLDRTNALANRLARLDGLSRAADRLAGEKRCSS